MNRPKPKITLRQITFNRKKVVAIVVALFAFGGLALAFSESVGRFNTAYHNQRAARTELLKLGPEQRQLYATAMLQANRLGDNAVDGSGVLDTKLLTMLDEVKRTGQVPQQSNRLHSFGEFWHSMSMVWMLVISYLALTTARIVALTDFALSTGQPLVRALPWRHAWPVAEVLYAAANPLVGVPLAVSAFRQLRRADQQPAKD